MAWEHNGEQCPLAVIDRRLEDVHNFWHQAEKNYFEPDAFRVAIQAAIQTARTVTFVLQKNKNLIPDFDKWYSNWQEKLGSNKIMRWMLDARNRIEKEGDLEAHSFINAEIVASHLNEGLSIQVPAKLFDAPLTLLKSIPSSAFGEHIKRNGILRIRRRWIENGLPDHEMLEAVASAYGQLSRLIHDAHCKMGINPPVATNTDNNERFPKVDDDGRLPCMIGHEDLRTLDIWLKTGKPLEFEKIQQPANISDPLEPQKRYGFDPRDMYASSGHPHDHARTLFVGARKIFEIDGHHSTILIFLRDGKPATGPYELRPGEHGHKYIMMRKLAHEANRIGADAVALIGEAWAAPYDPSHPYRRAADSSDRYEELTLTVVSKAEEPIYLAAKIERIDKKALLGQTHEHIGGAHFAFAAFYEIWGKPIPREWTPPISTADRTGQK